ncbi:MAG: energy-coupling factor transporter transmembrane component T family protein [Erysipelotrichaceae bacterium]
MNNFALGRYLPGNSFIHKLDPRSKLIAMVFLVATIFIDVGYLGYLIVGFVILSCFFLSKIPFRMLIAAIKPMMFMMLFLLIINIFVFQKGAVLWDLGFVQIYEGAIHQTIYIIVRLVLLITTTTILTVTTKPLDLTLGLEILLKPLGKIKFPVHEFAMMISIALRFIPTILDEATKIMKAQKSRGVDFESGTLKEKLKTILSLIIPLFASAFQRAEDLANSMEARGYDPQAERTRYRQLKFRIADFLVIIFTGLLLVLICLLAFGVIVI